MDKKDKIAEILESWEKDNGHYFNSISGSDYENIADEVVKLFAIPDVSKCCNAMCNNDVHKEGSVYCAECKDL